MRRDELRDDSWVIVASVGPPLGDQKLVPRNGIAVLYSIGTTQAAPWWRLIVGFSPRSAPLHSRTSHAKCLYWKSLMTGTVGDSSDSVTVSTTVNAEQNSAAQKEDCHTSLQTFAATTRPFQHQNQQDTHLAHEAKREHGTVSTAKGLGTIQFDQELFWSAMIDTDPKIKYLEQAVQHCNHIYGENHVATIEALLELGKAHGKIENYARAEVVLEFALLQARRAANSRNDSNKHLLVVASAMEFLAWCVSRQSRSNRASKETETRAIKLAQKAFLIRSQSLGAYHIDTVESLNVLAGIFRRCQKLHRACRAYMEVLRLRRMIFGLHHPSVAIAVHMLGQTYTEIGDYSMARRCFLDAKHILAEVLDLPTTNPSLRGVLDDLAFIRRLSDEASFVSL